MLLINSKANANAHANANASASASPVDDPKGWDWMFQALHQLYNHGGVDNRYLFKDHQVGAEILGVWGAGCSCFPATPAGQVSNPMLVALVRLPKESAQHWVSITNAVN